MKRSLKEIQNFTHAVRADGNAKDFKPVTFEISEYGAKNAQRVTKTMPADGQISNHPVWKLAKGDILKIGGKTYVVEHVSPLQRK